MVAASFPLSKGMSMIFSDERALLQRSTKQVKHTVCKAII